MVEKLGILSRLAMAAVVGTLLSSCSSGPSESEFVAACTKEGQGAASQLLDNELGVTRDTFCKCGASVAKSSLSSNGYRAMILDMQGKREEAASITSKMRASEQEASVKVLGDMVDKCGRGAK